HKEPCTSSGKSSTVAKLLSSINISSGKIYTNSGKSTRAVGINMTNSGNALEHFIPNNGGNGDGGNRGNGNGKNRENGNGNRNRNHGMNYRGFMPLARETIVGSNQFSSGKTLEARMWLHHEGLCTVRCGNYKKVGHLTRDCTAAVTSNTQRAAVGNKPGVICYECGRPGHFKKDCPKLRNQNRRNQTRNKTGNQTGGNEATTKAYVIGGGGTNHDSNVVTGMFLLNNSYASMLFDSSADRSFVSSTFSALLDVAPST
ncbi:putative reverse transcriptase domain-containing protein, partial [Tanacetum coccineum]